MTLSFTHDELTRITSLVNYVKVAGECAGLNCQCKLSLIFDDRLGLYITVSGGKNITSIGISSLGGLLDTDEVTRKIDAFINTIK